MKQHFTKSSKKFFNKKVRYLLAVGIVFLLTALPLQSQKKQWTQELKDSLETVLNNPNASDDEIYTSCKRLFAAYIYSDTQKSLEYTWKGINLAKKRKHNFLLAEFYYNAGVAYHYLSKIDSSLYYYEQALVMQEQAKHKEVIDEEDFEFLQLELLIGIGTIYHFSGKFDMALDHWLKALDMAEKMDELDIAGTVCANLAENYSCMMNLQQAETYLLKADKFFREINHQINIADMGSRLSKIYTRKNDYQKALEYAEEAYNILSSLPDMDIYHLISPIRSLAMALLNVYDYEKALEYALIAVDYSKQVKKQESLCSSLSILSKCYLKLNKYKEAEEAALHALELDISDVNLYTILYQDVTKAYIGMKNSEKALEYFDKTLAAIENFSTKNFQSSISEMEVKYNTEKKEIQIAALKEKNTLMMWIIVAGGGVLLLGLVALFFLWLWTVQKRRLAESYIKQIEQEKQIVATQSVFDGEVQERTRLARDLHDGMGSKLTAMKIHLEKLKQIAGFDNPKEEQFNIVMDILDDSVQEMRRVSHNLMPETLSHAGLKPAVDEFCRSMSSQIIFNYYGDETRLDLKLEALIYRIIHELVNNALKYSAASQIMVQIAQEQDTISFTVQDNGRGFDTTAQTEGMGLQSIRTRVASFGGDIQIDSKVEVGTEVNVELKIDSSASLTFMNEN